MRKTCAHTLPSGIKNKIWKKLNRSIKKFEIIIVMLMRQCFKVYVHVYTYESLYKE